MTHDETLTVSAAAGVLSNDFDADLEDQGSLVADLVTTVEHGSLSFSADGSFTYVPDSHWAGDDSFTYRAWDGAEYGGSVEVDLEVEKTAPFGRMDVFDFPQNGTLTITADMLMANDMDVDGDAMTVEIAEQPKYGSLTDQGNGSWLYTPNSTGRGLSFDLFKYRLSDGVGAYGGSGYGDDVLVTLVAKGPGVAAYDDRYRVMADSSLTVSAAEGVLKNDWATDGNLPDATLVSGPSNGTLHFNSDGSFTYTPTAGFGGDDSFTYKLDDDITATANIHVFVLQPAADGYTILHDHVLTGNVLDNDFGLLSDVVWIDDYEAPSTGTLQMNPDGSFVFTPDDGFTGQVTFRYKITNAFEVSDFVTVTIDVTNTRARGRTSRLRQFRE